MKKNPSTLKMDIANDLIKSSFWELCHWIIDGIVFYSQTSFCWPEKSRKGNANKKETASHGT